MGRIKYLLLLLLVGLPAGAQEATLDRAPIFRRFESKKIVREEEDPELRPRIEYFVEGKSNPFRYARPAYIWVTKEGAVCLGAWSDVPKENKEPAVCPHNYNWSPTVTLTCPTTIVSPEPTE